MDSHFWIDGSTATVNYTGTYSQTWKTPTDVELRTILWISSSICLIGTISNILSLTFFFLNWSNRLGEKLLVLLNILDLLVCLSATIYLVFRKSLLDDYPDLLTFLKGVYFTAMEGTGFVTTSLTVVRSVTTYRVSQKSLCKGSGLLLGL